MGMKLTAALALMLAMTPAASFGQSLVIASNSKWAVSASYAYSQKYHDGAWIQIDIGMTSRRWWTIQPHRAFHLLTPDGERIDLPDQRAFRRGLEGIQAMYARAATMQLSPWLAFSTCRDRAFVGWPEERGGDWRAGFCRTWRLWGNGGVDLTQTVGPTSPGGASLFFESPSGTWADGRYTLVVSGPDDAEARLPIILGVPAADAVSRSADRLNHRHRPPGAVGGGGAVSPASCRGATWRQPAVPYCSSAFPAVLLLHVGAIVVTARARIPKTARIHWGNRQSSVERRGLPEGRSGARRSPHTRRGLWCVTSQSSDTGMGLTARNR